MKQVSAMLILAFLASMTFAGDEDSHWQKAYPPAEKGTIRHVLHLPPQADEHALKVELIVGKIVEIDGVNHYFFAGKIDEEMIQGWGYPRYNVSVGPMGSTLMGVDPNQPKVKKFISLGTGPYLIRYNSRLPAVVYAPEGFEFRYRIWRAGPEEKPIDKG